MHLTKDDIEHVGFHRFNKKHTKIYIIVLACLLGALLAGGLGFARLFPDNQWVVLWIGIPIMILAVVWIARYGRAQRRATDELISQCEADPYLIYVPDQEVAIAKEETINPIK